MKPSLTGSRVKSPKGGARLLTAIELRGHEKMASSPRPSPPEEERGKHPEFRRKLRLIQCPWPASSRHLSFTLSHLVFGLCERSAVQQASSFHKPQQENDSLPRQRLAVNCAKLR